MRGAFLLLGLLAAAVGRAESLKLKLNPYQVDCVTEIANEHDRVSGSFVGFLEGRHYGDVYPQRAYFDLEARSFALRLLSSFSIHSSFFFICVPATDQIARRMW